MRQRLRGVFFFGVAEYEKIIGYVSAPDVALAKEFCPLNSVKPEFFLTSLCLQQEITQSRTFLTGLRKSIG